LGGRGKPRTWRARVDEPGHALGIEIGQRCLGAGGGIEGAVADQLAILKPLHQGGIEAGDQLGAGGEAAPHQGGLGLADKGEHARIAAGVVGGLEKDQAGLAAFASPLEFPLCRRKPLGINAAVLAAEQAHVELGAVHQVQVKLIGAAVAGGQVFEQHRLEEAPQQRITLQEVAQGQAIGRELLLHAAEEEWVAGHGYKRLT
jgi:hypothetical protein